MNVRWLEDDTHLISVGGNDKCVFQWKASWGTEDADARAAAVELDTDDEVELKRDGAAIDRSDQHTAATSLDFDAAFNIEVGGSCLDGGLRGGAVASEDVRCDRFLFVSSSSASLYQPVFHLVLVDASICDVCACQ